MPQTLKVEITQPHKVAPVQQTPNPKQLRISGRVETPVERAQRVLKTIRSRCFGVLSEADLALVLRYPRQLGGEARRAKERDA
jgi:hypothetical protein